MVTQQNSTFIDPENCGSSVGYYINIEDYENKKDNTTKYHMMANVVLADCNHKIDWSFGEGSVEKIDAAIKMLQEFRKKYLETEKTLAKLRK